MNPADRRREPRREVSGTVYLKFENESADALELELMDISVSGFRASHHYGILPLGSNAVFRHPEGSGVVRVVWNWMHADHVETGFIVVRQTSVDATADQTFHR